MIQLRPSGSAIWTNCPAAPRFALNCEDEPESDAAREGTAAAWVAETVLNGNAIFAEDLKGETHSNGWLITPDMCEHVQGYIDLMRARGGDIRAEKFVRLNETIGGTLDCSATVMGDTLYVDDLKYGYGIVEPYKNPQLIIYGSARLAELLSDGVPITKVQLGIYQPRAFHDDGIYRTWSVSVSELKAHTSVIEIAGQYCQSPTAPAIPGEWCKHCVARHNCEALTHTVYDLYEVLQSGRQTNSTMTGLAGELAFLQLASSLVEARKTAVTAEAEHRLRKGEHLPGWHLKERKGHRKLKVSATTVQALTGIDPNKSVPRSPSELEKAGASVRTMKHLTTTPAVGWKLERLPEDFFTKELDK